MRVGSIINITQDDFIRLAPLGLVVTPYLDNARPDPMRLYYDPEVSPIEDEVDYEEVIQGYVFGYLSDGTRGHLCGYWSFLREPVRVLQAPRFSLYKRHT